MATFFSGFLSSTGVLCFLAPRFSSSARVLCRSIWAAPYAENLQKKKTTPADVNSTFRDARRHQAWSYAGLV